jgi:hypothetical protein
MLTVNVDVTSYEHATIVGLHGATKVERYARGNLLETAEMVSRRRVTMYIQY